MRRNLFQIIVVLALGTSRALPGTPPKIMQAARVVEAPTIDGFLDEAAWQTASPAMDFTQYDPEEGALPTELTSVRILYDDYALYVGVICYDSEAEDIVPQLTRRDRTSEADRFTIQIDSHLDHQTAFVFSTNVSGVQSDGVLSQGGVVYDITWDEVWRVQTRWYIDGWSAEFEIPFNALRFTRRDGELYEWAINFRRYISRKHETDEWVMVPRSEALQIPHWGHLKGIADIVLPSNLSFVPYVSSTSKFESAYASRPDYAHRADVGLDMKYGITRNFTLDATINPDFGQVEVDRAVLNLTVFETYFPEKRPFFIEGSQLFAFGTSVDNTSLPLFFSRRIGKTPSGSSRIGVQPGGIIEENPLATTILGAAKVTGRASSGLSLGALAAVTDEEHAVIRDPAGTLTSVRTEPRASYNVLRVKQELGEGNSWLGALGTISARDHVAPAVTGGIDWNVRLENGAYALDGYVAAAHPSSLYGQKNGSSGRVLFGKIGGEHWFYTTAYDYYSRGFNINDIGIFAQPHDQGGYLQLIYRENFAENFFRRYSLSLVSESRWNWDGVRTLAVVDLTTTGELQNFWRLTGRYRYFPPASDDAERGIIGVYRRPITHAILGQVTTDERLPVTATVTAEYRFDVKKMKSLNSSLQLTVRPSPWLEFTPGIYYLRTRKEEAWVFPDGSIPAVTGSAFSLFGDRSIDELDFDLRGILTFTRTLSLQFYSQVLLARGKYQNYKLLTGSTTLTPYDYEAQPEFQTHDFNAVTFNANVLLRWEYLPGSELYLVWTQGRFGDSGIYATGFGERFRQTFLLPHEDVIVVKMNYRLPL